MLVIPAAPPFEAAHESESERLSDDSKEPAARLTGGSFCLLIPQTFRKLQSHILKKNKKVRLLQNHRVSEESS